MRRSALVMGLCLALAIASAGSGKIIYVDDDAPSGGDGKSWATAYRYLQDALAEARALVTDEDSEGPTQPHNGGRSTRVVMIAHPDEDPCTVEIRVAQGIYRPDCNEARPEGNRDRDASFVLLDGVTLKGGLAGLTGADPDVCDPALYRTVLSGDLAGDDLLVPDPCDFVPQEGEGKWSRPQRWCLLIESTRRENCRHVATATGDDQGVTLTGVVITGGNAYQLPFTKGDVVSYDDEELGGGILNRAVSLTLQDCVLAHNSCYGVGGAMFNAENCNLVMEGCRLVENYGDENGGGMNCDENGTILLTRCRFDRNIVGYGSGVAVLSRAKEMQLRDCTFLANAGHSQGRPIIYCGGGTLDLYRCVFRDNLGPGLSCSRVKAVVKDCLFQNNTSGTGGALRLRRSDANIENCSFLNNSSGVGGAINITGDSSDVSDFVSLKNSLFCGNYASDGGAIKIGGTITAIENCTFSDNRSVRKGGALLSTASAELTVLNSVFSGNSAPSGVNAYIGQSYLGTQPSSMSVGYCLMQGGQDSVTLDSNCTLTWGEGNFDSDPCFVNPGHWDINSTPDNASDDFFVEGDYHLKSQAGHWDANRETWVLDDVTSACIDSGDPNSPIGLEPVPNGGRINMGVYGGTSEASKSHFDGLGDDTPIVGDVSDGYRVKALDLAYMASRWLEGCADYAI